MGRFPRTTEQEPSAFGFEDFGGAGAFVAREVVQNDDVTGREFRRELRLDAGIKGQAMQRSVQNLRRDQTVATQSGNESLAPPVAEGCGRGQTFATPGPATQAGHLRGGRRFIKEHEAMRIIPHPGLPEHASDLALTPDLGAPSLHR